MGTVAFYAFFVLVVVAKANVDVEFLPDRPSRRVAVSHPVFLECCLTAIGEKVWWKLLSVKSNLTNRQQVNVSKDMKIEVKDVPKLPFHCGVLTFASVQLNDTGLYQCAFKYKNTKYYTAGTYLQVYTPIKKTINLKEGTKNKILTFEGVLLLLFVLFPSGSLLFKTKRLHELQKTKMKREEENIYQGLNLDECCNTYDQIERTQGQGPYEDVEKMEEEGEIELEKP